MCVLGEYLTGKNILTHPSSHKATEGKETLKMQADIKEIRRDACGYKRIPKTQVGIKERGVGG